MCVRQLEEIRDALWDWLVTVEVRISGLGRMSAPAPSIGSMTSNPPTVRVFGVERSDYQPLSKRLQGEIGQGLAADAQIASIWIAAEDAGTRGARHYLQIAVETDGRSLEELVEAVWPTVAALGRRHRVSLALAQYQPNPDLVPRDIVSDYRLGYDTNPHVTLHQRF